MKRIETIQREHYCAQVLQSTEQQVVRFKLSYDLHSKQTVRHPSLIDQYTKLLLSGTKKYSRKDLLYQFESLGSQISVTHNGASQVTVHGTVLKENLKKTLFLVHAMLTEPRFAQKEIDRTKKQLEQELREEGDESATQAYELFARATFKKGHPQYKVSAAQKRRDLKRTDRNDIKTLHAYARKCFWNISVTADVTSAERIINTLHTIHDKELVPRPFVSAPQVADQYIEYRALPSKANVDLCIGNVLPYTQNDERYLPFVFGLSILGKAGGFSGRLMDTVREKEGLTYMIYTRSRGVTAEDLGCWYVQTFFTPADLEKGIAATKREIKKLIEQGVTDEEVNRFRTLLYNQFLIAHESNARTLSLYHAALCAGKTWDVVREDHRRLQTITKTEIQDALREAIDPQNLVVTGAGPVDNR